MNFRALAKVAAFSSERELTRLRLERAEGFWEIASRQSRGGSGLFSVEWRAGGRVYFAAKVFSFDAGHRLVSHPELCRHLHGHTYRLEVVVGAEKLDPYGMVCDFKALSHLVREVLARYDHAMILAEGDPLVATVRETEERLVLLPEEPTAEVLARHLFEELERAFAKAASDPEALGPYRLRPDVQLVAVRLWETPTSWAEFRREG